MINHDSTAQNEETLRYLASLYASSHPLMHLGILGCTEMSGTFERLSNSKIKEKKRKENTAIITFNYGIIFISCFVIWIQPNRANPRRDS